MTNDVIVPSDFYFVPQDMSIKGCLKLMKEKSLSFLLINDDSGNLKGIFTLKDVMNRFDFLKLDKHIMEPVKKVMSHPVKTLPVNKLYKAAETMVRSNIRHLPITSGGRDKKVIGVIDMESILKNSVTSQVQPQKTLNLSVYSERSALRRMIKNSFCNDKLIRMERLKQGMGCDAAHIEALVSKLDVLIFDLSGSEEFDLVHKIAKKVIELEKRMVIIVAREVFLTDKERRALAALGKAEPILLIEKPIEGQEFLASAKARLA